MVLARRASVGTWYGLWKGREVGEAIGTGRGVWWPWSLEDGWREERKVIEMWSYSWVMRILSSYGSVGGMRVAWREGVGKCASVRQRTGAHLAHSEGMPDIGENLAVGALERLGIPIYMRTELR